MKHFYLASIISLFCVYTAKAQPFVEQPTIVPGNSIYDLDWGDYDNDGDLDFMTCYYTTGEPSPTWIVKIFGNSGKNSFTEQFKFPISQAGQTALAWGDYDNDGDLDILIKYQSSSGCVTAIYRNDGNNSFVNITGSSFIGSINGELAWGDYNNDGYLDMVYTGHIITAGVTKMYRNNGNSTFTTQTGNSLTGICYSSVDWGDYDNDGDLDLLMSGTTSTFGGSNIISKVYRNNGNGNFIEQTSISLKGVMGIDNKGGTSRWGDYDNDGDLDILLVGRSFTNLYKNNGDGTFTELANILGISIEDGSIAWGDYDNDGDLDILLCGNKGASPNTTQVSKIYRNNGNDSFIDQTDIALFGIAGKAMWVDYDSDGDLDIILYGYYSTGFLSSASVVKLYRNELIVSTPSPNIAPFAPTSLSASTTGGVTTLAWNAVTTDATPAKAMTYNLRVGASPGACNIVSPQSAANGYRRIPAMGNAQLDTTFILKNLASGTYYWSVQAVDNGFMGGAFSEEGTFTITSTGIKNKENNDLRLYPNPVTNILNIENLPNNSIVNIYSMDGKLYKKVNANNTHLELSTSDLPKSGCILEVIGSDGSTYCKFIKQ